MSHESTDNLTEADPGAPGRNGESKLVPVSESIKYRRRAQQAEGQIQQLEQQLQEARKQLSKRDEQLAAAEAQRDEAQMRLTLTENRMLVDRAFAQAGVVDAETASLLLSKRLDLSEPVDGKQLAAGIEQLLIDKPFLRARGFETASMPPKTASVKDGHPSTAAQLANAARRAIKSGNRRDIAEYLRLRRKASLTGPGSSGM